MTNSQVMELQKEASLFPESKRINEPMISYDNLLTAMNYLPIAVA